MTKILLAFAAALALPLSAPARSQAPAAFDLESVPPLAGVWSYRAFPGGSEAAFMDASATRRTIVRCNRAVRTVSIARTGVPEAAPTLSIWTTSLSRSLPSRFLPTRELVADVAATDPLLDAIAFSRGRFATGAAGAPLLAIPVSPEVERVIEECRA